MKDSIKQFEEQHKDNSFEGVEVGDTVKVMQKVKEGDEERLQPFEGLVIAFDGGEGLDATVTVRGEGVGGYFIERIYPIHSPVVEDVEVLKKSDVSRSKLYYMRDRTGKKARLKRKDVEEES